MASKKHNHWLDIHTSDQEEEDEQGYDSEAIEKRKGGRVDYKAARWTKRRRIESDSKVDGNQNTKHTEDDVVDEAPPSAEVYHVAAEQEEPSVRLEDGPTSTDTVNAAKPLTTKKLTASRQASRKTGVIYISRIPPFMRPAKVRSLLSVHGAINRIFLTPEDPATHTARVRSGGNKKRTFIDGWVEFESKRDAKLVAETLNTQIIGGKKKSGYYHDDVWNIKYLRGFKWHHLTDQIANENAERAARLRTEISRSRKEDRDFVRNVERAKRFEGIQRKRALKREQELHGREGADDEDGVVRGTTMAAKEGKEEERPVRLFRQNEVVLKQFGRTSEAMKQQPDEAVERILRKIF